MSLVDNNGLSAADVAAVVGGANNGNGFGWGNDGGALWWLIILFLFIFNGNGWGNGFGNNGGNGAVPYITDDVQRGFDQTAVMNGLNGISTAVMNGFSDTNANITNQLNTLAMAQQNCCCDNRLAIANLSADIAREACADRTAVSDALRDVIASNTANTQAILDKMCQQEIDALKTQNANLQTQINLANLQASQTAQTARILQDNAAQTTALEQYLNPAPIPAYVVQNPNCCGTPAYNYCGCNA